MADIQLADALTELNVPTASDLAAKVPTSRQITTQGLLSGGAPLSADLTFTVPAASDAEGIAGTLTTKAMTPASTKAATDAIVSTLNTAIGTKANASITISGGGLASGGGTLGANRTITVTASTNLQATTGTDTTTAMTPASSKAAIDQAIANLVASSPATLDTLNELAAALGNDPNFATTVTTSIGTKANSSVTITGGGLVSGGGNLTANRTLTVTASSNAQALAGTDTTTAMTPASTKAVTDAERTTTNTALGLKLNTADFLTTLQSNIQDSNIPTTGWLDPTSSAVQGPSAGGKRYQRRPRVLGVRTLAHLATVADVQGGGSITGLADNTNADALYGATSLRLTHTGAGALVNILPAATVTPVNTTGGVIRWTFKTVANFFANSDRFQIQLHSAGTPASPTANYHEIPVGSNSELKTRLTSQNGEGRWQKVGYPVSLFTAVGTGADLTNIIFAKLVLRAASGLQIIMDIGNIEWVPNILTKAKCVLTFDDGYLSQYTYAAQKMAKYSFRGVAYPGALANNISTTNAGGMTPTQLKHLHDDLGWQIGSQAWLSESPDVSNENAFTIEMAKQCNLQNALGLTGGEDGSYFSGITQYDANAFKVFRKMFRSMRVFGGGNASGPPLVYPEMFPFADDYLVRAIDAATGGWATPATNQQAHIDQAIAAKGVAIFAWHNQLASAGTDRTAFDTTLAYLDSQRASIDVCTIEDLYALM